MLPLGLPHAMLESDSVSYVNNKCIISIVLNSLQYKGYVIPRDATIMLNICTSACHPTCRSLDNITAGAIFHDPELFENPEAFEPERYLKNKFGTKTEEDGRDFRDTLVFGAGRVRSNFNYGGCGRLIMERI